jgi:small subunit ribosomal protein S20
VANIKSAEKRNRQNEKNRQKNIRVRKNVKTAGKKVHTAIVSKDAKKTETLGSVFSSFMSSIDSACRKGVLHWKTAARKKSRMAKKVNAAAK